MVKKFMFLLWVVVLLPLNLSAQVITTENYFQYIGKSLYFSPHKPWFDSYTVGHTTIDNFKEHGAIIRDIIVNKNKLIIVIQNKQTGTLKTITSLTGEVPLHYLSIEPLPI